MKKLLFVLIAIFSFGLQLVNAQNISPTAGPSICNCLPPNWGAKSDYAKVSNTVYFGNQEALWDPQLPPIPSGANTFLGIRSAQSGATVHTKVTGLIVGKKYKFTYSIITAKTNLVQIYMSTATFQVRGVTPGDSWGSQWEEHKFAFDNKPELQNVWITNSFEFIAKDNQAFIVLTTGGQGPIGLDVTQFAVEQCNAGVGQVPVAATAEIACPATSVNLVTETFQGLIPAGLQLKYFTTPDRSTLPLSNLNVGAGTYYAFYYDEVNNCYNTKYSTAKVVVSYKPCADLTPTITIASLNFGGGAAKDFVVNLFENNGSATSGNVSFRITKLNGFNITYPTTSGTSALFGGIANQNSNWTFTESAQFITASSTVPIPAKGKAVIGFNIKRKPGVSAGLTQNMTPTILSGAGGEENGKNNSISTSASTN